MNVSGSEQPGRGHGRMHKRWRDLSRREQTVVIGLSAVEPALASLAWADLASRPAALVRGESRSGRRSSR